MLITTDNHKRDKQEMEGHYLETTQQNKLDYDPALAQLFASSVRPARTSKTAKPYDAALNIADPPSQQKKETEVDQSSRQLAAKSNMLSGILQEERHSRKRRRVASDDDIELHYIRQLVIQEAKDRRNIAVSTKSAESAHKNCNERVQSVGDSSSNEASELSTMAEDGGDGAHGELPAQHETMAVHTRKRELEKASRTVFLGNVSTSAILSKTAKKRLMNHLTSFFPTLPQATLPHAIKSFRFRSTAFAKSGKPRKAAFIKQELMEATTRSTNAYVVYSTQTAAREAIEKLNGTMILDRHLRVDSVAQPAKQEHRRCVFVGNLSFVDNASSVTETTSDESKSLARKVRSPADIEEGLWRQFGKAGNVESVRVVRDETTRVSKGFAYVQFWDANAVEKALSLDGKKFPPMLPRTLRVTRAKSVTKTKFFHGDKDRQSGTIPGTKGIPSKKTLNPSMASRSLASPANKSFAYGGAALAKKKGSVVLKAKRPTKSSNKRAQMFKQKARPQKS